jgi:hypothetical protein
MHTVELIAAIVAFLFFATALQLTLRHQRRR